MSQPWRTEPEIDAARQQLLSERRCTLPNIRKGIYPFQGMELSRADVEWLLVTHDNGRGPVDWNDLSQRERLGLDLRGAILRGVDLSNLPLARLQGGLEGDEWADASFLQRELAAIHLEDAHLWYTQLQGAALGRAHLDRAQLRGAYLQGASLQRAHMQRAYLHDTHLEGTNLSGAHLEAAFLKEAHLEGKAPSPDEPEGLPPANLREAFLSAATTFEDQSLGDSVGGFILVADARWSGANLALIDWHLVKELGDERLARLQEVQWRQGRGKRLPEEREAAKKELLKRNREAVRAYRQLAIALREQGLNEVANRFAYRAQVLHRKGLWLQGKFDGYFFSLLLALLAGYGYKPSRSIFAYVLVILCFAIIYYVLGQVVGPPFSPDGAVVFSMTSFHGRGFFPGGIALEDPITKVAASEAFVGLIVEVSIIATFTQRFFGK